MVALEGITALLVLEEEALAAILETVAQVVILQDPLALVVVAAVLLDLV
jgi:gamma-glutamyl phosphate reductase